MKFKLQSKASFIFQSSKLPAQIYILSCAHISLEINMSLIQTTAPPPRGPTAPPGGGRPRIWELPVVGKQLMGRFASSVEVTDMCSESMSGSCFFFMSVIIHPENVVLRSNSLGL
jgi:hypothetical protein